MKPGDVKVGMKVDYRIGDSVILSNCTIKSKPEYWVGKWVVWLEELLGCVSLEWITPAEVKDDNKS